MSERDPGYVGGCVGGGRVAEVHQIEAGYELRVDGVVLARFTTAQALEDWHERTSIAVGAAEDALFRLGGGT